eukprot:3831832-Alexandrium_andersonii.AAC.1
MGALHDAPGRASLASSTIAGLLPCHQPSARHAPPYVASSHAGWRNLFILDDRTRLGTMHWLKHGIH